MEMTYQQYIDNPMGKRNAVFSQRDMYKALYTEKFDKLFLREAGKIDYTLYTDKLRDRYIIHLKIPSETVKNFYYDAVIMFYTNDVLRRTSPSLQDYNVKFFSNDPAFVFTYLRVFLKNDLLVEDLKPKCSKLALKKDPVQTNPYQVPGYSKILYFAYLFMKNKNLFMKSFYNSYGKKYNASELVKLVEHADDKIAKRQELGAEARVQAREEVKKQAGSVQREPISPSGNITNSRSSSLIKNTPTVKKSNTVGRVKATKKVK